MIPNLDQLPDDAAIVVTAGWLRSVLYPEPVDVMSIMKKRLGEAVTRNLIPEDQCGDIPVGKRGSTGSRSTSAPVATKSTSNGLTSTGGTG